MEVEVQRKEAATFAAIMLLFRRRSRVYNDHADKFFTYPTVILPGIACVFQEMCGAYLSARTVSVE